MQTDVCLKSARNAHKYVRQKCQKKIYRALGDGDGCIVSYVKISKYLNLKH